MWRLLPLAMFIATVTESASGEVFTGRKYVSQWGSRGSGPGQFQLPHNPVVIRAGGYVSDRIIAWKCLIRTEILVVNYGRRFSFVDDREP
jgi:hypothetical protein